ncbi:MAG: phenylalanine--tRNA ligase subunit alpha [Bacilli bacterium]|nr:phenylalanine--tRNA ligase subunit alpha [Bacilli bacterium]
MKEQLKDLVERAKQEADLIKNENDFLNIKSKYLGKKSELANYMSEIKNMSVEDKKEYGPLFNKIKKDFEELFTTKLDEASNSKEVLTFDPTIPCKCKHGSLHPVTLVGREVSNILKNMGFMVLSGPEMETEYYNFEALNVPKTHPARDMQDTYWLDNGMLLRTQTSALQVRGMQKHGAPIKLCAPGRCFRNEDLDACHENTFFQLEGMVIDENISISNLIYTMEGILKEVFHKDIKVRLRPGYFPFTEPGFELDCSCTICDGKGCPTCKNSGWLELCPCGMIHPNVLEESGIDSTKYSGFAFGIGLTRLAMMKYKINDIRVLNSGDLRYLENFNVR